MKNKSPKELAEELYPTVSYTTPSNAVPKDRQKAFLAGYAAAEARAEVLKKALEFECGGRCDAHYNPCNAREVLQAYEQKESE